MNNIFLEYTESNALKELGFNESCFGLFDNIEPNEFYQVHSHASMGTGTFIKAPLYDQAFDFFEKEFKLNVNFTQYYGEHFYYQLEDMVHPRRFEEYPVADLKNFDEFKTKHEARLAAIKHLIKLTLK
jgi:hypothetical protein